MNGYSCGICKLKAHKSCVSNVVNGCKWITLDSVDDKCITSENGVNFMQHQWIEGNLPVSAKCSVCDKNCGSIVRYVVLTFLPLFIFLYLICILDYKTGDACGAVHACILHVVPDLFNIVR